MSYHKTQQHKLILTIPIISAILVGIFYQIPTTMATQNTPVVQLKDPLKANYTIETLPELFGKLIIPVLGIIGSLTLLVFVYGGFIWMTSAGSPEKIKKGTNAMLYAAIGLCIIFSAYGILNIVTKEFIK